MFLESESATLITEEDWNIQQIEIGGRNKRGCHFCLF